MLSVSEVQEWIIDWKGVRLVNDDILSTSRSTNVCNPFGVCIHSPPVPTSPPKHFSIRQHPQEV